MEGAFIGSKLSSNIVQFLVKINEIWKNVFFLNQENACEHGMLS